MAANKLNTLTQDNSGCFFNLLNNLDQWSARLSKSVYTKMQKIKLVHPKILFW